MSTTGGSETPPWRAPNVEEGGGRPGCGPPPAPATGGAGAEAAADVGDLFIDTIPHFLPYLTLRDAVQLASVSKDCQLAAAETAESFTAAKVPLAGVGGPSWRVFSKLGAGLLYLHLHRVSFATPKACAETLALCPNLRRLSLQDCVWDNLDGEATASALSGLIHMQELRLGVSDMHAERNPLAPCVRVVASGALSTLRKLTLFMRLDAGTVDALRLFFSDSEVRSKRLMKVKVSTGVLVSPGGTEALAGLTEHLALQKLTVVRPEGMGEPLRRPHCQVVARLMATVPHLHAVHLRRCGMWVETLVQLAPSIPCPNVTRLKLDGNSLGYLSGSFFSEALDGLLAQLPRLQELHLGNNQIDSKQAEELAASIKRHRLVELTNLTLGSNDLGDTGLAAVLKALPNGMRQLYLHGIDCTDKGVEHVVEALDRFTDLWGLGLNGNAISDVGAAALATGLANRPALRDVGITLSDMTDTGCLELGAALRTCPNLRYCYLYTSGFKSSKHVTEEGKAALRAMLPPYATAAYDHRLSRYLKTP